MNKQAAINEFKNATVAAEAAIAAVNPAAYVIMWNGAVLRTDGARVAILGPKVYTGDHVFMKREAAKFQAVVNKNSGIDDAPVTVHTAAEALAIVKAENARLLKSIEAFHA